MPDRRRFGHVNVICVHSNTVLVRRREMEEGQCGTGVQCEVYGMRQLVLSKGPDWMGIRSHV